MNMTHYMELLAVNQPWNLILFMGIPVFLAETVAVTELFVLFRHNRAGTLGAVNRAASIAGGLYFCGVFAYLMLTAVVPLTAGGGWRGPADVVAVGFYLAGIFPLLGLALIDLRVVGRGWNDEQRMFRHAFCVAVFLVVAHVAMFFGMLDPTLLWDGAAAAPMDGMEHGGHGGH